MEVKIASFIKLGTKIALFSNIFLIILISIYDLYIKLFLKISLYEPDTLYIKLISTSYFIFDEKIIIDFDI